MRIYKTIDVAVEETMRDLMVRGETVQCKSYQNKKLEGDDQYIKELIGVSYKILHPQLNHREAVKVIFKDDEEADKIIKYIDQEFADRTCGKPLNPGNSYLVRQDMWQKFLEGKKFSYTYPERFWTDNQIEEVLDTLRNDKGTRQALLEVWQYEKDNRRDKKGGGNRIPCSLFYWFTIRHNDLLEADELHCIYNMRSNDLFGHHVIDITLACKLLEWMAQRLKDTYPDLRVGTLTYQAESLHAFRWDLKERVQF